MTLSLLRKESNVAKKLTPKQVKFVEEYAKTGNATESAMKAYDTEDRRVAQAIGSENLSKPIIRTITEQLFPIEKSVEITANLHKLATQSQDEKIQVDATKEWLSHAVPKEKGNTFNNFGTVVAEMKDKYAD